MRLMQALSILFVVFLASCGKPSVSYTYQIIDNTPPNAPTLKWKLPAPDSVANPTERYNNPKPTILAEGLAPGDIVTLFLDAECKQPLAVQQSSGEFVELIPQKNLIDSPPGEKYRFYARSSDVAKNLSECVAANFLYDLDATPPQDLNPPGREMIKEDMKPTKSKKWEWGCYDLKSLPCEYQVKMDRTADTTIEPVEGAWTSTATALTTGFINGAKEDGNYFIHIVAKDSLGNISKTFHYKAILDNTPPTIIDLSDDSSPKKKVDWSWRCSDAISGENCKFNSAVNGPLINPPNVNLGAPYNTLKTNSQPDGNGRFWISVRAEDEAGNESTITRVFAELDNIQPAAPSSLSLVSPATSPSNEKQPTFKVSGAVVGDTVELYGGANCTGGVLASGLASATELDLQVNPALPDTPSTTYQFSARNRDEAGNTSPCSPALSYTLDTFAPALGQISDDPNPTQTKTWSWTCNDLSGGCTYKFRVSRSADTPSDLDSDSWVYANEPITVIEDGRNGTVVEDGSYWVHIRAKDIAGNISEPFKYKAELDNTPPVVDGLQNDSSPKNQKTLSWSCLDNSVPCTFKFEINQESSGDPDSSQSGNGYAAASSASHNTGNGTHYIHVRAKDRAGNISTSVARSSFVMDTEKPNIPVAPVRTVPATSPGNNRSPQFSISSVVSGDTISLHQSSDCSEGSRVASMVSSGTSILLTSGQLAETSGQDYRFYARATDPAGNQSDCSNGSDIYRLDTVPPMIVDLSDDAIPKKRKTWELKCNLDEKCYFRHEVVPDGTTPIFNDPLNPSLYTEVDSAMKDGDTGRFHLHVRAIDQAGNYATPVSVYAELDNTAPNAPNPQMLVTPAASPSNDRSPKIRITGTNIGDTIQVFSNSACSSSVLASGVASGGSIDLPLNLSIDGDYTFYARAIDVALNESTCSSTFVSYRLDTTPPVILDLTNDPISTKSKDWAWRCNVGEICTFYHTVNQTSNTPLNPQAGDFNSTDKATQGSGDGTYYLHVRAKDNAGNLSEIVRVSAILDNTAPVLSSLMDDPVLKKEKTWKLECSDTGSSNTCTYVYQIIGPQNSAPSQEPAGVYGTISSATQDSGTGRFWISARAKDDAGNTSEIRRVYADLDAVKPTLTLNQKAGQADPAIQTPIEFIATFSEAINPTSLTVSDLSFSGVSNATWTIQNSAGADANKVFTIILEAASPVSDTVTLNLPADSVEDSVGNTNESSTSSDNSVSFTPKYLQVAGGEKHTCAIKGGSILCWGNNSTGQLGDGTFVSQSAPTVIDPSERYKTLSVGSLHSCGITRENKVKCWGDNQFGQLGTNDTVDRNSPTSIQSTDEFATIAANHLHTCGITVSGALKCWGNNSDGQLGNGTLMSSSIPVSIDSMTTYSKVTGGKVSTCGITTSNALKCWGKINSSQSPLLLDSGTDYLLLNSSGESQTFCGTTLNGKLKCWGRNAYYNFGDGLNIGGNDTSNPQEISSIAYQTLAIGAQHTCGRRATNDLYCWGNNSYGRVGAGLSGDDQQVYSVPEYISPHYLTVTVGADHSCGIDSDRKLFCWGRNNFNQLGMVGGARVLPTLVDQ